MGKDTGPENPENPLPQPPLPQIDFLPYLVDQFKRGDLSTRLIVVLVLVAVVAGEISKLAENFATSLTLIGGLLLLIFSVPVLNYFSEIVKGLRRFAIVGVRIFATAVGVIVCSIAVLSATKTLVDDGYLEFLTGGTVVDLGGNAAVGSEPIVRPIDVATPSNPNPQLNPAGSAARDRCINSITAGSGGDPGVALILGQECLK